MLTVLIEHLLTYKRYLKPLQKCPNTISRTVCVLYNRSINADTLAYLIGGGGKGRPLPLLKPWHKKVFFNVFNTFENALVYVANKYTTIL